MVPAGWHKIELLGAGEKETQEVVRLGSNYFIIKISANICKGRLAWVIFFGDKFFLFSITLSNTLLHAWFCRNQCDSHEILFSVSQNSCRSFLEFGNFERATAPPALKKIDSDTPDFKKLSGKKEEINHFLRKTWSLQIVKHFYLHVGGK